MIDAAGYAMAVAIGLCLGLMGSGGSILTVPVLVYVFRLNPILSTAYSLFIVGTTSLAGLTVQARQGKIRPGIAATFAIPSLIMVYLVRGHFIHNLPEVVQVPWGVAMSRDAFIMGLFALVLAGAGVSMLWKKAPENSGQSHGAGRKPRLNAIGIGLAGLFVGALTGLVGAGGGFLIVPVLVLLGNLPMKSAVGTSLAIITAQSFTGFFTDWRHVESMDWRFLAAFSLLSIGGAIAGGFLERRLDGERLRTPFAWTILALAAVILAGEIFTRGA